MPSKAVAQSRDKQLYAELRRLSWEQLWNHEVPRFNQATPAERIQRLALVRAVGVVFSESGPLEQTTTVKTWLRSLLHDPAEKIRRYAIAALPKVGASAEDERALLSLLQTTASDREKKFLFETLEVIGGAATLQQLRSTAPLPFTDQRINASLARQLSPSAIRLEAVLPDVADIVIHLRVRAGLESMVAAEVNAAAAERWRVIDQRNGLVAITPRTPFALRDLYAFRCFGQLGFVLGTALAGRNSIDALASIISAPLARRLFKTFTQGAVRYRLDFVSKGHQRAAVRDLAARAYAIAPELLNDARQAPWMVEIHSIPTGDLIELCPKLTPDPRYYYRRGDVPAASYPPLAACMARLAGSAEGEIVWDPFCGSGTELIERALLGGVRTLIGTDRDATAVAVAKENFAAANLKEVRALFKCCDLHSAMQAPELGPGSATLVITNPPMGKRVPVANLRQLIEELFEVAARVLRPGGRLVLANPLPLPGRHSRLKLHYRQQIDMGGFHCHLEKYLKLC